MQTITRSTLKLVLVLMLVAAMFGVSHPPSTVYAACSPAVSFDLYAKTGSAVLYGSTSVTIWGYSQTSGGAATLPGNPLIVDQGQCVSVTLHNVNIPEATSLVFQGQSIVPDTTGVTAGNSVSYLFTASNPGTFLYEAGLTDNAPHQVAMGMYGALIVRPSGFPSRAYSVASTAFNKESVMVLSEFDTALYTSPNTPATFDMRNFKGRYLLVNGKAYPDTGSLTVAAGDKVLLRYINAGVQAHAMSTLGLTQTIIAQDGSPYTYPHKMVAETIATGQTLDTLVTIPVGAVAGSKFSVYDANMLLKNNTGTGLTNSGMGGMVTFLSIAGSSGGDTGPLVSGIVLSPNPSDGSSAVTVTASVSDATTGNANIQAAEYYIDSTAGTAYAMAAADAAFDSPTESVTGTISTAVLASLASGNHTIYVRGQDANNNWGPFSSGIVNLAVDHAGPAISALAASPNPSNGSSVNVSFTASDVATGNNNVTAAEYWIGAGAHQPITVSSPTPLKNLVVTLSGLSSGTNVLSVRAQDAFGNWGAASSMNLIVDNTAPTASGLSAQKNPNNGSNPYNSSVPAVRVFATFTDTQSNIAAGEGFLNTVGATGTGFVFIPTDGSFNSGTESAYADIPLAVVGTLGAGSYPICVHAKDTVGNWGVTTTCFDLVIDKTPPTAVSITSVGPSLTNAASVQFTVNFSEAVTGLTNSNFTVVQSGGLSGASISTIANGSSAVTVTVNTGSGSGTLGLNLTSASGATDLAGNALLLTGIPMTGPTYSIDKIPPTVLSINRVNPSPTTAASVQFLVTFSESVTGGAASNFSLTTTGTFSVAPSIGIVSAGPRTTRTVTVNTGSGNGTIRLNMSNSTGVADPAGNAVAGLPFNSGQTYTVDTASPTVVSINRTGTSPTNGNSVQFTVTFSESVTGVTAANFTVVENLAGTTSVTSISGSGTTRTVTVSTGSGGQTGTLGLNMTSSTGVVDGVGNSLSGLPFTGQVYAIDKQGPTVLSITRAGANPTNASSVQFTVTFSESVTGVSSSDFSLSETLSGTTSISVGGTGATRTVTVTTGNANQTGTLGLNVPNGASITDAVGNSLAAGLTGQVYNIDKVSPTVVSINRVNANPTSASSVQFTVTFSESITGGALSNFGLTTTGTYSVAPSITSVTGSGTTRTVTINTGTNSGGGTHTIRLDMLNSTGVSDAAGNTVTNVPYTSGQSYTKN